MEPQFVIDNSVVMAWCYKDEESGYADTVLDTLEDAGAIVPSIWPLEVVNVLAVAERKQRLSEADSVRFITLISQLPIKVEKERPDKMMTELLDLARSNNLSSYDAAYLYLAMREELPLATLDNRLIAAAKRCAVQLLAV